MTTKYQCRFCDGALSLTGDVCSDKPDLAAGKCDVCRLVQLVDCAHIRNEYYAADDHFPPDLESLRRIEWNWNRKRVEKIEALIPDSVNKHILDFGCGPGGFLEQAQGHFRQITGFELSKNAVEAHQAKGWRCVQELEQVPADVDLVALFHVLEHVPEPWKLLIELQERFRQAELFVIEVPNHDEVLNSLFRNTNYRRNHFNSEHLNYFTSETLRKVVEAAALEVVVDSQLQRYSLANNLGWLSQGKGGGQVAWDFFNDELLNLNYERVLVSQKLADSVFIVARRRA